jgi:hypothetical protein
MSARLTGRRFVAGSMYRPAAWHEHAHLGVSGALAGACLRCWLTGGLGCRRVRVDAIESDPALTD